MGFTEEVINKAWKRAKEKCECRRSSCGHRVRCNKELFFTSRGKDSLKGWEAHHILSVSAGGHDGLSNCEILCQSCHKNTRSYGR